MSDEVRPPDEHAAKPFHWVRTPAYPNDGEPLRWVEDTGWLYRFPQIVTPAMAARLGWEWMAPCG